MSNARPSGLSGRETLHQIGMAGVALVLLVGCVERPLPSKSHGSGGRGGTGGEAAVAGTGGWSIDPNDTGAGSGGGSWNGGGGTESGIGGAAWGGAAGAPALPDDATCGVDFEYPYDAYGAWVEGEEPAPLGGEIRAGVYDLWAYYVYTLDPPEDIDQGFDSPAAYVYEFAADGTLRMGTPGWGLRGLYASQQATLVVLPECPEYQETETMSYTAVDDVLYLYLGYGLEYVLIRRADST